MGKPKTRKSAPAPQVAVANEKTNERRPAPTWDRIAKSNVMHRSHSEMSEIWRRQRGEQDELSLQNLVNSVFSIGDFDLAKTAELKSLPGSFLAGATELRRLQEKAIAASTVAADLHNQGRPTWGSVDAYHASFLTAKVILAIFGIFIVTVAGSNFFVDLSPGEGDKDYRRQFAKESRGIEHAVRFMTIRGTRLEHRHVWELLRRIGAKCTLEPLNELESRWFKNFDFTRYSSIRNKVIYGGFFWSSFDDLQRPLASMPALIENKLLANFHDNVWMEDELRDHLLMAILSSYAAKLYPF